MTEDRQNILKSFQGKKIDQSVHVARWGTINNEDSNRNIFQKYAAGSSNTLQQQQSSSQLRNENGYNTQQSQVHQIDTGFKKLKTNQIDMLKQLKQEYEVLRNLNFEEKPSMTKKNPNIHSSSSSMHHIDEPSQQILSSSSHRSKKKLSKKQNRQTQILTLQKKQLQMVINNSMRKIEELLHSEMQYKKQIHELKLQVSSRQNTDGEYESMLKTLKKNQINQHEAIQSLKKQNQKNRYQIRQLNEKLSSLEGQVIVKEQQIHRLYEQKRKSEDLIRLEKDRYFNIDIDYKKIKMEYELLEKDKNSQINRLLRQYDYNSANKIKQLESKLKFSEDDVQIKDKRYSILLTQLQDLKKKLAFKEHQIEELRSIQASHVLDKQKIEEVLVNFKDQNDSVSFNRNINDAIQKLKEVQNQENQILRQQIELLRMELDGFKDIQPQSQNIKQYSDKIEELQRNLRLQMQEKDGIIERFKRFQRDYDDLEKKNNQYFNDVKQYESLQSKLRQEIRTLKIKISQNAQNAQNAQTSENYRQSQFKQTNKNWEVLQKQFTENANKYRQKIDEMQDQIRKTKRVADQNEFKAAKANTELQYRLRIQQNEHNSLIVRINEDLQREKRNYALLKQQYDQYKGKTEKKLDEREKELQSFKARLRSTTDNSQSSVSNIKLEYESLLKSQRQQYKTQIEQLTTQITSLSKVNEKYLQETNKYVHYENELTCLREIMRRSIHLSEGVDHLWRIKETQYQNVNQILKRVSNWNY